EVRRRASEPARGHSCRSGAAGLSGGKTARQGGQVGAAAERRSPVTIASEEPAIARLLHQSRQAELPVGSGEWLLAVIGAVAAQPPVCPPQRMPLRERRAKLEEQLRASGLAYGTGAQDPAVKLDSEAAPGERAFAHFVAGLVRLCASAAAFSHARWFVPGPAAQVGVRARRAQLLAVLAAAGGDAEAAA